MTTVQYVPTVTGPPTHSVG